MYTNVANEQTSHLMNFTDRCLNYKLIKVIVHRPVSDASHATDFSLSCIETHTTASTDPHRQCPHTLRADDVIRNACDTCDAESNTFDDILLSPAGSLVLGGRLCGWLNWLTILVCIMFRSMSEYCSMRDMAGLLEFAASVGRNVRDEAASVYLEKEWVRFLGRAKF
uniref:SFRICE_013903 n=1 Tax=Spodoptera frugiperda TaxID=7108 RepID=A0A2H1VRK7_SPOFR